MSLPIPTTSQLNEEIIAQLEGALGQAIPILPKAFLRVLAKVLAGVFVMLFRYGGFIFLQMFAAHATMSETTVNGKKIRPLVELGRLLGVGDPQDATRAELNVSLAVSNQTGTLANGGPLPRFLRTQTGVIYTAVADVALDAEVVYFKIRATGDQAGNGGEGDIGNLQVGDTVALANPLPNVGKDATVVSQAVTAADAEQTERYRSRIFQRMQRPPQGGAYADYQLWAEEVEGIVHAYPYTGGPGMVDVYIEASVASSGDPDGFPTPAQITAVYDNIEYNDLDGKPSHRPVNAAVKVRSITRAVLDVEIAGLLPDAPATREAIEEGLTEFMLAREPYIVGLSALPRDDRITLANVSGIVDQIASANGASVTAVALLLDSFPITAYSLGPGEKAKFGSPTYV